MASNGFAILVSPSPPGGPLASHIPLQLEAGEGRLGTLYGHVAKANPHAKLLESRDESLAIFMGPHAYISATAYDSPRNVPTWNYMAVHAYGRAEILRDPATIRKRLGALVEKYEHNRGRPWDLQGAGESFLTQQMQSIVSFRIEISRLEGKAKLSQNRSPSDRASVMNQLYTEATPMSEAVALEMQNNPPREPSP